MSRIVTVAAAQLGAIQKADTRQVVVARMLDLMDQAKARGADFIVYGKLFTSNPDLPARFQKDAALVDPDPNTFYGGGETGYITYSGL